MVLLTLTANHRDLDLDLLEQLSSGAHSVGTEVVGDASITGCVVLATCNRFELYLDVDAHAEDAGALEVATKSATEVVSRTSALPGDAVAGALARRVGGVEVARHLFAVASGLESMVIGEREVAGQVRRALTAARGDGTTTPSLEQLFQAASRASRAVASGTDLGVSGRSVVAVALDLASRAVPLAGAQVLVVGTGSYARATVSALRERGVAGIAVHSPSGRAEEFARGRRLRAVPAGGLAAAVAGADVVVGCSGTPGVALSADDVRTARAAGDGRPAVLVDLALRHDIDPAAGALPGVTLIDLATVQRTAAVVAPEVADADRVVATHAARFAEVLAERELVPAVVALRDHVHRLLDEELDRVPAERRAEVEPALRHFAAALLHRPVVRAREHARRGDAEEYLAGLRALLGLDLDQP